MNKLPQKVQIAKDVLMQELDNTVVILNLNTEQYYGLDNVGCRFWELLSEEESLQQIYNTILQEYDVSPEVLEKDMLRLVDRMAEAKLIRVVGE